MEVEGKMCFCLARVIVIGTRDYLKLFPILVSMIASVPGHCLSFTLYHYLLSHLNDYLCKTFLFSFGPLHKIKHNKLQNK